MEELDYKYYLGLLLKNKLMLGLIILITLISSVVVNYVIKSAPVTEYKSESTMDLSKAAFIEKTFPAAIYEKDVDKKLIESTLNGMKTDGKEVSIKLDLTKPNLVIVKGESKNKEQLDAVTKELLKSWKQNIINKYQTKSDEVLSKLEKGYKEKIIDAKGQLLLEPLKLYSTDATKQNEFKSIEIIALEKTIAGITAESGAATAKMTAITADGTKINEKIALYKSNVTANETSIKDSQIMLEKLKELLKSDTDTANKELINKQLIYIEQNKALNTYYKDFYSAEGLNLQKDIMEIATFKAKATEQLNLINAKLQENKVPLDKLLVVHNAQIEGIKKLYNIAYNNDVLNKIEIKETPIKEIKRLDARPRAVIVSVWLAFVLGCCFILGREYYFLGKNKIRINNK